MDDLNLAQQGKFPAEKVAPGAYNSRVKCLPLQAVLSANLGVGDEILGLKLPENAKIVDATLRVSGTAGATGIFDMGLKAGKVYDEDAAGGKEDFSEDSDALVKGVDAGGQAALGRMDETSVMLGGTKKRVGPGGLQVFVICTEITADLDSTPADLEGFVYYTLES